MASSCAVALPAWRVFALALAVQVPCVVVLHVAGVLVYALRRDRRLAPLLWPAAAAIGALPFWLLPLALARAGADAQLGAFVGATAFSFSAFRTIEAALGTTPTAATVSLHAWLLYFTSSIDPVYADGARHTPAAPGALRQRLARVPVRMIALGALCSLLLPHGPSSPLAAALARARAPALVVLWASNVIYSIALWLFLALCFDVGAAPLLAQGVAVGEAFLNPVFAAHSPKEFWGQRWNRQVNALLRRACFKPLASVAGPAAAALLTFGVSALFHEYQFALTFQGGGYRLGRVSAFFGAMASLCLAQTACERVPALRALARALPEPVQIGLNICTLAPFGHWFVLIWVEHGFMDTIARMVPTLSCA